MQLKNNYYYFKSALTPKQCTKILEAGMTELTKKTSAYGESAIQAQTADGKEKGGVDNKGNKTGEFAQANMTKEKLVKKGIKESDGYVRDSSIAWLNERWIYDLLHPYIHEANAAAGWSYEWNFSEACQFTKYSPGQFYGWHADGSSDWPSIYKPTLKDKNGKWKVCDFVMNEKKTDFAYEKDISGTLTPKVEMTDVDCPVRKQLNFLGEEQPINGFTDNKFYWGKVRKLSCTLLLNDTKEYKGGSFEFDLRNTRDKENIVKVKELENKGDLIVFPSHLWHRVRPVTSGKRLSLVVWFIGPPFK